MRTKIQKTARRLRVYAHHSKRNFHPTGGVFVPEIKLQGQWLEHAGFEIGQHLDIDIRNGVMIIKAGRRAAA